MSLITLLLTSFLSVALIAFGWMPCPVCCSDLIFNSCCDEVGLPTTLFVTMTKVSGPCTCLDGAVNTITWVDDPGTPWGDGYWQGSLSVCGCTWTVRLACHEEGEFAQQFVLADFDSTSCPVFGTPEVHSSFTCSPFSLSGTIAAPASCFPNNSGTFSYTVTE